ncbi:hypothetical protein ACIBF5_25690 [Micromonospora sp. NPDC050417]|uniref:hypothetical protein n=1 Tax=Micromonospora sp. NPDC050417 TaxID=3364280 RepID=UPI003794AB5B
MFPPVRGKPGPEVVPMVSRPSKMALVWTAVAVLVVILVVIVIALAADGAGGGG